MSKSKRRARARRKARAHQTTHYTNVFNYAADGGRRVEYAGVGGGLDEFHPHAAPAAGVGRSERVGRAVGHAIGRGYNALAALVGEAGKTGAGRDLRRSRDAFYQSVFPTGVSGGQLALMALGIAVVGAITIHEASSAAASVSDSVNGALA